VIQLYKAPGADGFTVGKDSHNREQCAVLFENAARLLTARGELLAAEFLRAAPFKLVEGANHFDDEFSILYAIVPLKTYEELRIGSQNEAGRLAMRRLAEVITELGVYVRFIAVELSLEQSLMTSANRVLGLKQTEINKVIYKYIGVSGGYLGDFSYRSHFEFYVDLDLEIDPNKHVGTTRQRFTEILSESSPQVQSRILEGILARFPVGGNPLRTAERAAEIQSWIERLRRVSHAAALGDRQIKSANRMTIEHQDEISAPKVFVCYAKQDVAKAIEIYDYLIAIGASPWMDKRQLVLGDAWQAEIENAVANADAFVACLRPGFDAIGFRQQEVRWAIEALQRRPLGKGFIIPFIIEACNLPIWCTSIHAGHDLSTPSTFDQLRAAIEKHTGTILRSQSALAASK
jgi:TIR domain-containing protein